MYQFWHDYDKTEYGEKAKFCYMDIDSVKEGIKTFLLTLQKMLKKDLILQVKNQSGHQKKKTDVRRLKENNEEFIKSNKVI